MSTSGVGTQARWLINGLANTGKYSFVSLGGAQKHENYNIIKVSDDFIIKPVDGFGNRELIRQILAVDKPDAMLLFTDPRFFVWLWEMEEEVHQMCPITYWHLWDNEPYPAFNSVLYESTDLINCINYPTYEMLKDRYPEKVNFVPHALPRELYFPMSAEEKEKNRASLLGLNKKDHFVPIWVSRNARRKMPSDVIVSWKMFIDQLKEKHGHTKATLLMHTDPMDPEGPNLHHVLDVMGMKEHVVFSKERVDFPVMNVLYNISDCVVSRSCAEGFGLSILEAMQAGLPAIALKTGGMTRQVVNHRTGVQNGIAMDVEVKALVGNQMIPYIWEDYVSHETLARSFMEMYEMGPEKRSQLGLAAREYALEEFNIDRMIKDWDDGLTSIIDKWQMDRPQQWEAKVL